jgi:L-amino acid N-acyltransferase YncA
MHAIRAMSSDDWPDVVAIYEDGIATGLATFETATPSWDSWNAGHLPAPRLVAVDGVTVVGWAAVSPVSARPCYRGVVEASVYVAGSHQRRGLGRALLEELVAAAPQHGVWTIQTSIFAANEPSLALHRGCGFREVGLRERIAQRDGAWHDTILLELRLQ